MNLILWTLSLCLLNSAFAMEKHTQYQADQGSRPQTYSTEWQKTQALYQSYQKDPTPLVRREMIRDLHRLLSAYKIDLDQSNEALIMAESLKAPFLVLRIRQYQTPGDYGDFHVLHQEMVELIIQTLSDIGSIKDLYNMLRLNKVFRKTMISAPVHLNLSLHAGQITNDILGKVVDLFPNLTSLNLRDCVLITDAGLGHVTGLKYLTSLSLEGCYQINDVGLGHLTYLTNLKSLNLRNCVLITDTGLRHLTGFTTLTSLNLWGCYRITDDGLELLKGFPTLTYLELWGCSQISDKSIRLLQVALPKLRPLADTQ